jgi:PAS domain S-box-containing protein
MSSVPQPARGEDRRGEVGDAPDELSEPAVRTLLDRLPAILYVADVGVGGRWHYVSSGAADILGFTPAEWTDDPGLWARQVHPDDRDRVFGREDELVEPSVPDEYRFLHRDGRTVWVRDEAALVSDEQGRVRWHGVMSDVTERKLAEAELERRAEQQAAVARLGKRALEGAEVGVLMHDALTAAAQILGVDSGAVLERTIDPAAPVARAGLGTHPLTGLQGAVTGEIEGRDGAWGVISLAAAAEPRFADADADFVQALANILADALQHEPAKTTSAIRRCTTP